VVVFALALTCLASLGCATMKNPQTGFLDRTVVVGDATFPYVVYVPRDWTPDTRWPVILFLHGAGERGTDGLRPTEVGIGAAIRFVPERVRAIVVFPQAPAESRWIGTPADAAMRALDRAIDEFSGDRERVVLTGLSMGGYGVWHLALAHPDRFAALVPVCGGIVPAGTATSVRRSPLTADAADPYTFTAGKLRHIAAWLFHGTDDTVVLPSESRRMHEALRAAGARAQYTEYERVGHDSWSRAYGEDALWSWMLRQQRESRP
jgi:predicted peptidase